MHPSADTAPERVLVVSASVGAGHDGAAYELAHRLSTRGVAVEVRDFLDALPAWLRFTVREGYTGTVNHTPWFYDWLYAAMEKPGPVQRIALLVCWLAQRRVLRWSVEVNPDAVVSTYPLASQTLGQLVGKGQIAVPTATFLTDPSVHSLWVHRHIGRHLTTLAATAEIVERLYGVPATVAGPLVPARFSGRVSPARRAQLRDELGVGPGRPVALVVTGSLGLGRVEETVDAIVATGAATPLVLCGRNERLRRDLDRRRGVVAVGWRDDVDDLMRICDVMVHNAGGMSFSESLVAGLPAVTFRCIPGHGHANGEVLAQAGIAPLAVTVDELATALREQLRPCAAVAVRSAAAAVTSIRGDAAGLVLGDLRTRSAMTHLRATRSRARRRSPRRRVSTAGVAAVVAVASLVATEGVAAATGHGLGVARMPEQSVALVVAPTTLAPLRQRISRIAASRTAVLVPDHLTRHDVATAQRLAAAGVELIAPPCSPTTLIAHSTAHRCGPAGVLADAGVQVGPIVLFDGEVEGPEILVARRDRTSIVINQTTGPAQLSGLRADRGSRTAGSGVWLIRQAPRQGDGDLLTSLRADDRLITTSGLRLRPVTDARTDW